MSTADQHTSFDEIDEIHRELTSAFRSGKTRSIQFRKNELVKFAYMIRDNKDRIIAALFEDQGKLKHESVVSEITPMIQEIMWAYEHIDDWVLPDRLEENPAETAFNPVLLKEPKGVVLYIMSYNFPFFNARGMPGAMAAGCGVVLKPSEFTPKTNALLAELFPKYLDPSLYRIVQGGVEQTMKLLSYRWGHTLFVGSTRVGKIVAAASGQTLTPITLELGGQNPALVHSTANMDLAARCIMFGKFFNAGQMCVSPNFTVVLEKDKEAFVTALKIAYKNIYGSNPKTRMTLLKTGRQWERLNALLTKTRGKIVAGGESNAEDKYMDPTIVIDVDWDDPLVQEEIFGPILPVICVSNYENAFENIRKHGEPLTAYIFHNDSSFAEHARNNITSGCLIENETQLPISGLVLPVCGRGSSGMGRGYKGKTSYLEFTHFRPFCSVPEGVESNPLIQGRYAPYTDETYAIITSMIPEITVPRPDGI